MVASADIPGANPTDLKSLPLAALHREHGARFAPFAGYEMPLQYPEGVLKEHLHARRAAALFDVSHMGQVRLHGLGADALLEELVVGDIQGLKPFRQRYTLFTDAAGGILDDLMVSRLPDPDGSGEHLFLVVNAANREADVAHLTDHLSPRGIEVDVLDDHALLALQGPAAAAVLARLAGRDLAEIPFMGAARLTVAGVPVLASRCGYTGEDGFELSIRADLAEPVARALLAEPEVAPAGLGARDSLRLEAGLCLHGADIDPTTTPIEADLAWTISPRRRREGGFPGAATIRRQLAEGVTRQRVGIRPQGGAPARAGTAILDPSGREVGRVTSGGFGPSAERPVAMGYVPPEMAEPDRPLVLLVRDKPRPARVAALPFVPHRFFRGK
ncbi:glycine cleavage system aminomethyltransferase GcvT [Roseospirillum parvum]|uniref:aminomethyltransferase n=1 Tax=Roseospirillum parvum TaxID=83401 RepID=A0A1G8FIM4_9PROT|nr:glycine cleavage system aminomethyltransferase GcvT [Roseospirillum parvum]SDH82003.1 aminomethyltransferase [Roseospirillum parvum]